MFKVKDGRFELDGKIHQIKRTKNEFDLEYEYFEEGGKRQVLRDSDDNVINWYIDERTEQEKKESVDDDVNLDNCQLFKWIKVDPVEMDEFFGDRIKRILNLINDESDPLIVTEKEIKKLVDLGENATE